MPKMIADLFSYIRYDTNQLLYYLAVMAAVLYLLRKIISHLQSKEIKSALKAAKKTGISFGQALAKQATPPRPYPWFQFLLVLLFTINYYLGVLVFFSVFSAIVVLTVLARDIPFLNFLAVMGFAMVSVYFAMFLFAEAERGRLALPTLWAKCRCASRS